MDKEKIYFPNLNGLRCFAAFAVIIPHIEQLKSMLGISSNKNYLEYVKVPIGHLSVVLFFVLSGFLITYLLLIEEKVTNNINIKDFYIRRMLRIWPLYFFIIILAIFILPNILFFTLPGFSKDIVHENLILQTVLYFTLFSNLAIYFGVIPYASQAWSIGTEEQFYLIWPVIIRAIKNNRAMLMVSIVVIYNLIKKLLNSHNLDFLPYIHMRIFAYFWEIFSIDCMAIGGLFAVFSFYDYKILKIIQNKMFFYFMLLFLVILVILGFNPSFYLDVFYSLVFGALILNFSKTKNIYISLENKVLNILGKMSYGLYMYHPIAIVITLKIGLYNNILSNYFFYPFAIILTILLSSISYYFFEMKFLAMKEKYSNIRIGNSGCDSKNVSNTYNKQL